jgi:DNA (cytosine-5)-methyltransferase 1
MMANDNDAKKAASYVAHWSRDGLIVADVASLTTADLPGVIALALASPPCKGAGLAGKRKGLGPETWAFMGLMHGLRSEGREPKMIVIENVLAMLTSNGGRDFDRLCYGLDNRGYHYGVVMIDAALFVPQSRKRVFVVAVDAALNIPAAIVADRPRMPFHSEDVVKALRRHPSTNPGVAHLMALAGPATAQPDLG